MGVDCHTVATEEAASPDGGGDGSKTAVGAAPAPEGTVVYKKGAWTKEEDEKLRKAVEEYGVRNWVNVEKFSGLVRPAKNCRLRWLNYLRPNLKKYAFTPEEEKLILQWHSKYGNSWSRIAANLPGRSDNEIKNFWHKRAKKCKKHRLPIYPDDIDHHINVPNSSTDETCYADADQYFSNNIPTSYPTYAPPSTSILSSPRFQPKTVSQPTDAPPSSTHSSQTLVSAPQPQFLSSPSTTTSSSPTAHTADQIRPTPPTQNLLLSPHHMTQSNETPLSIPGPAAPHTQAPSFWQGGAASNAFTSLRKPPILSPPQGRSRRFSRANSQLPPTGHPNTGSALSVANASAFQPPPDSPLPMPWPPAMESPRSPLKLGLSYGLPPMYSVQMSTQMTDAPVGSLSGIQLKSPPTPLSPLKLRLSTPVSSESGFHPTVRIPDSTVQLNSYTASVPFSPSQLRPVSCCPDLPPIQQVNAHIDDAIPMDSSPTVKTMLPPIQFNQAASPGANSSVHEVESDSNLEIMDELREAEAKVRFLKKKLRKRGITNKRTLLIESPTKASSSNERGEKTDLYSREITTEDAPDRNSSQSTTKEALSRTKSSLSDILRVSAPTKNSRTKHMQEKITIKDDMISVSKTALLQVEAAENMQKLQKRDDSESEEYTQESVELEQGADSENSDTKTFVGGDLQRQNLTTSWEHNQPIDIFDHISSQNTINSSNSESWNNNPCPFQFPAGECMIECSAMEGLLGQSPTLLQDDFLKGDMFGQRSGIGIEDLLSCQRHVPLTGALGPVYSQSTATTLEKPGNPGSRLPNLQPNDGGYFGDSFGQELSDVLERKFADKSLTNANLSAASMQLESNLLQQQYSTSNLQEFSYLVSKPIRGHEPLEGEQFSIQTSGGGNFAPSSTSFESNLLLNQYPETNLINSGYVVGEMEQKSCGGEQFSLQTSGSGKLAETTKLSNSTLLPHQQSTANLVDSKHLVDGFEHEYTTGQQHSIQISAAGGISGGGMKATEFPSKETWKREPSREQSLEGLLIENLWPETQMVSQDQALLKSTLDSAVNPSTTSQLMESKDWNDVSCCQNAGEIQKQQQEEDHMNTMPEELSSLLEYFPTTMQTLEWSTNCNAVPEVEASNAFDMGQGLHMSSASQPLMTIADNI